MQEEYVGLKKLRIARLLLGWSRRDHVVLLMYDSVNKTFGCVSQRDVERAQKQVSRGLLKNPALVLAEGVFKKLISDRQLKWKDFSASLSFAYYGSSEYVHLSRHFVLVSGTGLSDLLGPAYRTLDSNWDLVSEFGPKNGPAFAEIIDMYMSNKKAA